MMTSIIKIGFLLAITHASYASIDHGTDTSLAAQSSFGGTPLGEIISESHHFPLQSPIHHVEAVSGIPSTSFGTPVHEHDLDLIGPQSFHPIAIDNPIGGDIGEAQLSTSGAAFGHGSLETLGLGGAIPAELENFLPAESNAPPGFNLPQVIPNLAASNYELQSVVQNIVRRTPIEVVRHIQVPIPQPVPVPGERIQVPIPQPVPVPVNVIKHVPYPIYKTQHVEVERPVPVPVVKHVPIEVVKQVPVPVERPFEIIKHVHVPVEKRVEIPIPIWKPHPIHVIKHITHYKKW